MAHTKETEMSGLMPRHEWKKLETINDALLGACKEVLNDNATVLSLVQIQMLEQAINQAEEVHHA